MIIQELAAEKAKADSSAENRALLQKLVAAYL